VKNFNKIIMTLVVLFVFSGQAYSMEWLKKAKNNLLYGYVYKYETIQEAIDSESLEVVKSFLENKSVDLNKKYTYGGTILHYAVMAGYNNAKSHYDIVSELIDSGADVSSQDGNGNTVLHLIGKATPMFKLTPERIASIHAYELDIIKKLIKKNPELFNVKNKDGKTPGELLGKNRA